jgi:hypothetical protein
MWMRSASSWTRLKAAVRATIMVTSFDRLVGAKQ